MARFFTFDGLDGVGKSTQLKLFCQWLEGVGHKPVVCRDPGSTSLGESIREILLKSDESRPIGARAEMLLYMAARAQMVDEIIRPALQAGQTVVSDRFLLANIVYQGHAGGLDIQALRQIGDVAVDGVHPDCTFLLDMDPALALKRVDRQLDRVERRGDDYRQRLRAGFLAEAEKIGKTVHRIDGNRSIDAVQAEICQIAAAVLAEP